MVYPSQASPTSSGRTARESPRSSKRLPWLRASMPKAERPTSPSAPVPRSLPCMAASALHAARDDPGRASSSEPRASTTSPARLTDWAWVTPTAVGRCTRCPTGSPSSRSCSTASEPQGLYVLDEPEAALSPARQLAFLRRLHDLVRQGSQFLIATHSPIVLAYPTATIYRLDDQGLSETSYDALEHVTLTRDDLNHRDRFLERLHDDEDEPRR